jgi:O-antigen ligase
MVFNPHPVDYDYENYFFNNRFAVKHHPTYLAMYSILSLIISLESLLDKKNTSFRRFIWIFIGIIFFSSLYLLSSRAGFIAALIIIVTYFIHKTWPILPKWIVISLLVILGGSLITIISTNNRLKSSLNDDGGHSMNINNIVKKDNRFVIWNAAFTAISHNPILGSGTGNATAELNSEYLKINYSNGYALNLNTHNQFLEVLLENGLIGLLIFLGILFSIIKIATGEKNFYLLLFLIMTIIFFSFESMLNRLAGVSFFSFFSMLLIHLGKKS